MSQRRRFCLIRTKLSGGLFPRYIGHPTADQAVFSLSSFGDPKEPPELVRLLVYLSSVVAVFIISFSYWALVELLLLHP
jgi:hypothetical protein